MSDNNKHKVFLSYYHSEDQFYKNRFEQLFNHLFINKSVMPGDINPDNSTEYVAQLIRQGYITDSSVIVVLVGNNTYKRKHVDWEIAAGLDPRTNGRSGLLGLLLPTYSGFDKSEYYKDSIPERLLKNIESGFASIRKWTDDQSTIKHYIQSAFDDRITKFDKAVNPKDQMQRNAS